jgi:glycine reductase complex component B subunit gamma
MANLKAVHYINQFYAGLGGEEKADYPVEFHDGEVMGPGVAFKGTFGDECEIVSTIVCGDSYFAENMDTAKEQILNKVKEINPDVFIAGPAFNAGRYGVACGTVADAVKEELGIPVVTGMYEENPGADMFKTKVYIVPTKNSAAGMKEAVGFMAPLALKLAKKEPIGVSSKEHYMPNGIRVNFFEEERGSKRAVDMLLQKLGGKPFTTEFPMPSFDRVPPNPAVKDITKAKIALCTSGGICPKGNPDHIEASNATRYGEYDIAGVTDLTSDKWETAHGGYDPVYANEDPDRVLPVDVMRDLEKEGKIGELHHLFYTTVGNGTAVKSAKGFAEEYSKKLLADGVDAVIMTST